MPREEVVEAAVRAATSSSPTDVTRDQIDEIARMTFDRYNHLPPSYT